MKTNIPFDSSKESKKLITYSSLISDEVKLYVPQYEDYLGTQFYDQKLLDDLAPLEKKGIVKLVAVNMPNITLEKKDKEISSIWHSGTLKKLLDEYEFLYSQFDSKGYNAHAQLQLKMLQELKNKLNLFNSKQKKEYHKDFLDVIMISGHPGHHILKEIEETNALKGELFRNALMNNIASIEKKLTPGYRPPATGSRRLEDLTMLQLKLFYDLISKKKERGETILTNDLLNVALSEIGKDNEGYKHNELKQEALEIGIPNYSALDFEDIIRLRESKEFEKMRSFVDKISKDFSADEEGLQEAKKYIKEEVNPKIAELKKSIENLSFITRQNFYDDFLNPQNYAPLVTTFIPNLSSFLGPAITLGFLAIKTAKNIDKHLHTKKANEDNDLYFAVKFPKMIGSGRTKL
jgi:hypothetical protein